MPQLLITPKRGSDETSAQLARAVLLAALLAVTGPAGPASAAPFEARRGADRGNEAFLQGQSIALFARLKQLRIPVTTDFYGPGTHTCPYWERELHRSLPILLGALGRSTPSANAKRRPVARVG